MSMNVKDSVRQVAAYAVSNSELFRFTLGQGVFCDGLCFLVWSVWLIGLLDSTSVSEALLTGPPFYHYYHGPGVDCVWLIGLLDSTSVSEALLIDPPFYHYYHGSGVDCYVGSLVVSFNSRKD
ncbi:hypothetical protein Tco_0520040 [Tanacetum coccineum]